MKHEEKLENNSEHKEDASSWSSGPERKAYCQISSAEHKSEIEQSVERILLCSWIGTGSAVWQTDSMHQSSWKANSPSASQKNFSPLKEPQDSFIMFTAAIHWFLSRARRN
jgi:hypothetical protein